MPGEATALLTTDTTNPLVMPPVGTITIPVPAPTAPAPRTFTQEEVNAFRTQERDKLYGRLSEQTDSLKTMQEELAALKAEREREAGARAAAEAKAEAEAEAAAKTKAEAEMSAKEYAKQETGRLQEELAAMRREREEQLALFEKERAFAELRQYTQAQVNAHRDQIAPELLDLVTGDSREQVDASIALLVNKSSAIVESLAAAQAQARQASLRGVSPTGRPTSNGPLDNEPGTRTLTPQNIREMSMADYAANRQQLLAAASNHVRTNGLYG